MDGYIFRVVAWFFYCGSEMVDAIKSLPKKPIRNKTKGNDPVDANVETSGRGVQGNEISKDDSLDDSTTET